jgi:signal recognition particle GTPase
MSINLHPLTCRCDHCREIKRLKNNVIKLQNTLNKTKNELTQSIKQKDEYTLESYRLILILKKLKKQLLQNNITPYKYKLSFEDNI